MHYQLQEGTVKMETFSRKELNESYRTTALLRDTHEYRVELIEHVSDRSRLIKRTYYEDRREIFSLLLRANPPHVAQIKAMIFDVDTILLEEYIEGQSLKEYLLHTSLSSKEASRIMSELLCAVSGIHNLGIIHRDIKPDNVLIDKSGHVFLIDFGIARIYRPNEQKDTRLLGTVGYAAPEQFGYAQSDFRTDIFSLGITCQDIIQASQGKNRLLKKIARKCTKMDPAERYSGVDAILEEFKKKRIQTICTATLLLLLPFMIGADLYFFLRPAPLAEQESSTSTDTEYRIFTGQESAPCLLLTEKEQKKEPVSLAGQAEPVLIQTSLSMEGLSLSLTDSANHQLDLLLSNDYPVTDDYPDTFLYAELLFYDIDSDGQDEIWVAISDRCYLTLANHSVTFHQNYIAGWCIYYDENKGFRLADGQLFADGNDGALEIDQTIPGGIWIENVFEGYVLQDGALKYLPW